MAEPSRSLSKAADQVRQFNHTSRSAAKNWEYPSHSYSALGSLAQLVRMLPQAIEQTIRPVMHTYEHGRVLIDNGGDADQAVRDLTQALSDALSSSEALAVAVDRMHSATSPMGLDITGIPEFAENGDS
ncbi:hypothetical protein OG194_29820 [Streptomyces sp. NBC_01288]|uniref:hypothetical protein n=1 Tax=Streptomyces sp. NBC_01288 TaxID=2903814 RepID=UPI002E134317|nr:hypothetical protein OG194_29820 [Streptomyces sp. NBC_01288]